VALGRAAVTISAYERSVLRQAAAIIERETAEPGAKVVVYGFGTFRRRVRKPKNVRGLKSGPPGVSTERTALTFKCSRACQIHLREENEP